MRKFNYIFRPVNGCFVCVFIDYAFTIDDVLSILALKIDDHCQFCRIIRDDTLFVYRRYNNSKIILTVYEQNS